MDSPDYQQLHVPAYSLVSNPLDIKYQNCNEFMLDVLAAAAWETTDMQQIKVNLQAHFKPTKVKTNLLERALRADGRRARSRPTTRSGGSSPRPTSRCRPS